MRNRTLALIALSATVLIWGTTFVATKVALRELQPFTLSLLRFLLGLLVLLPLAWWEQRRTRGALAWRQLALAGLLGGFLFFALQNVGLVYTTAAKGSLIVGSVPALTAIVSFLVLGERSGRARLAGVAASVLGVAVIVVGSGEDLWQGGSLLGDLMMLGSALTWALYTVQVKGLEKRVTPAVLSAASVGFGALFLVPFAGYELLAGPWRAPGSTAWLSVAYLGLVASAVPFLLWNLALKHVDASEAAVYTNVVPVVAVAGAVLLLGESLAPLQLLGGAFVLGGVWAAGKG
ncbi:MAG: DMT family transporter [Chloroflexi bacterium]|nr:DMT family transporter [Chloroflexota bacterium]